MASAKLIEDLSQPVIATPELMKEKQGYHLAFQNVLEEISSWVLELQRLYLSEIAQV